VREDGVVVAAGRYLNFDEDEEVSPVGARHMAAAGISREEATRSPTSSRQTLARCACSAARKVVRSRAARPRSLGDLETGSFWDDGPARDDRARHRLWPRSGWFFLVAAPRCGCSRRSEHRRASGSSAVRPSSTSASSTRPSKPGSRAARRSPIRVSTISVGPIGSRANQKAIFSTAVSAELAQGRQQGRGRGEDALLQRRWSPSAGCAHPGTRPSRPAARPASPGPAPPAPPPPVPRSPWAATPVARRPSTRRRWPGVPAPPVLSPGPAPPGAAQPVARSRSRWVRHPDLAYGLKVQRRRRSISGPSPGNVYGPSSSGWARPHPLEGVGTR
jgi:hypothetical protein